MGGSDTRWGSNRTRQAILTIVLVGILLVVLALALALVQSRSPKSASALGGASRIARLIDSARKPDLP